MEFKEIVSQRYATKKFDGKKIDQKKIDELFELIRLSASSYGLQPYSIKIISDDKTKKLLAPHAYDQPQITTCSHLMVFCADTDVKNRIKLLEKAMIKGGSKKEDLKGFVHMLESFEKGIPNDEARKSWAQRQAYLALGNAINGAKSLGFDSCPMEGFNPAEFSKILKLPQNLVPTALCAIGYASPDDKKRPKVRLAKEDIFF